MKIISLGGVGGCELAAALRKFNQPTYPYNWLITSQSFIIKSFNNFDNFFNFDDKYVYTNPAHYFNPTKLLDVNKKAIMLHDFKDYSLEKNEVIARYRRRFDRLNYDLTSSNEDILFVRINDNLSETLMPLHWYDDIFDREEEDINKWNDFIGNLSITYNKKIKLLFLTNNEAHINCNNFNKYNNVLVHYTKEHKNPEKIYEIIIDTINNI